VSIPFGMIVRWRLLFAFAGNFLEQRKNNMITVAGWWGLQYIGLHDELFTFSPRLCKVPSWLISTANILYSQRRGSSLSNGETSEKSHAVQNDKNFYVMAMMMIIVKLCLFFQSIIPQNNPSKSCIAVRK
jgi:hypothetical protein